MLPSTGYFKDIPCPFFDNGCCYRQFCHFRHSEIEPLDISPRINTAISPEDNGEFTKLVSEAVNIVLQQTRKLPGALLSPSGSSQSLASNNVPTASIPSAQQTTNVPLYQPTVPTYNPTPIVVLHQLHNPTAYHPSPKKSSDIPLKRPSFTDFANQKKRTKIDQEDNLNINSADNSRKCHNIVSASGPSTVNPTETFWGQNNEPNNDSEQISDCTWAHTYRLSPVPDWTNANYPYTTTTNENYPHQNNNASSTSNPYQEVTSSKLSLDSTKTRNYSECEQQPPSPDIAPNINQLGNMFIKEEDMIDLHSSTSDDDDDDNAAVFSDDDYEDKFAMLDKCEEESNDGEGEIAFNGDGSPTNETDVPSSLLVVDKKIKREHLAQENSNGNHTLSSRHNIGSDSENELSDRHDKSKKSEYKLCDSEMKWIDTHKTDNDSETKQSKSYKRHSHSEQNLSDKHGKKTLSDGCRKQNYSEKKPRNSHKKQNDSRKNRIDSHKKLRCSENKLSDRYKKHTDSEKNLSDSHKRNSNSERNASDNNEKQDFNETKPGDSYKKHSDSERNPIDSHKKSSHSKKKMSDSHKRNSERNASDNNEIEDCDENKPSDSYKKHSDSDRNPSDSHKKRSHSEKKLSDRHKKQSPSARNVNDNREKHAHSEKKLSDGDKKYSYSEIKLSDESSENDYDCKWNDSSMNGNYERKDSDKRVSNGQNKHCFKNKLGHGDKCGFSSDRHKSPRHEGKNHNQKEMSNHHKEHGQKKKHSQSKSTTSKHKMSASSSQRKSETSKGLSKEHASVKLLKNSGDNNEEVKGNQEDYIHLVSTSEDDSVNSDSGSSDESVIQDNIPLPSDITMSISDKQLKKECYRIYKNYKLSKRVNMQPITGETHPETEPTAIIGKRRISHKGSQNDTPSKSTPINRTPQINPKQMVWERLEQVMESQAMEASNGVAKLWPKDHQMVSENTTPSLTPEITGNISNSSLVPHSQTIARTAPKHGQRIAHKPSKNILSRPIIIDTDGKISTLLRQSYLNKLIDEYLKFHSNKEEAYKKAVEEELVIYNRSTTRVLYPNLMSNAISRLRKNALNKVEVRTSSQHIISHTSVLATTEKKIKGSWSIEKPKYLPQNKNLYEKFSCYILTEDQLKDNGYPRPHPEERGLAMFHASSKKRFFAQDSMQRVCERCTSVYYVNAHGLALKQEQCIYHWGRSYQTKVNRIWEAQYSCCHGNTDAIGCVLAACHVSEVLDPNCMTGFVTTLSKDKPPVNGDYGIYALDCEMCYTTIGLELARITVIGTNLETVYETLVKPKRPIIDYNTHFSGIKEEDMKNVTTSIYEVQSVLLSIISDKTILVGHSLESDFKALKLIHNTVVDTSIVFPHKDGPTKKRALKTLCREILKKLIQEGTEGHDSAEDAKACMELMMHKIREDKI